MLEILAIYDVTNIQNYIYESNRLRDNIGASNLVENCLEVFLVNVIKKEFKENEAILNWKNSSVKFFNDTSVRCEVVYVGGGNALILYRNEELWKNINYKFSLELLEKAPGLSFVTEKIEVTNNFNEDRKKLFSALNEKKNRICYYEPMRTLPITKECSISGKPASKYYTVSSEYISNSINSKREAYDLTSKYELYKEFDDLGGKKGESLISIVHIDGNNMGAKIEEIIDREKDYEKAIGKLRSFSKDITEIYNEAYENMLKISNNFLNNNLDKESFKQFKKQDGKYVAPFRKILIKGDDVTYVCYGKFALSSVEIFFHELKKLLNLKKYNDLSACAGVCFLKPHFPFDKAYNIAESCCSNAKIKAKTLKGNKGAYYLDFHVIHSGVCSDLNTTRNKHYNLEYLEDPILPKKIKGYNLLWRPYEVMGVGKYSYEDTFKKIIENFSDKEKWPRSKVKAIRNSLFFGEEALLEEIFKAESRGNYFVELDKSIKLNNIKFDKESNITPYYDPIEMLDLYIDLQK